MVRAGIVTELFGARPSVSGHPCRHHHQKKVIRKGHLELSATLPFLQMFTCHVCLQRNLRLLSEVLLGENQIIKQRVPKDATRKYFSTGSRRTQYTTPASYESSDDALGRANQRNQVTWKQINKGKSGDDVISWRDSPNYRSIRWVGISFLILECSR